jgi:hypothetical protein
MVHVRIVKKKVKRKFATYSKLKILNSKHQNKKKKKEFELLKDN